MNPVVHFELPYRDATRAARFWKALASPFCRFLLNNSKHETGNRCSNAVIAASYRGNNHVKQNTCIDHILERDNVLGEARNHACETISLSETIDYYVDGLKELGYADCPEAFKMAILQHAAAWLELKQVTDEYPNLRGEMHELFRQLEAGKDSVRFIPLQKNIWDTWREVEKLIKD